jgi:hypothetical protein
MTEDDLIVGHFYWVMPALDVDRLDEWEAAIQPARFAGRRDDGQLLWHCLNIDGPSDWPMRLIDQEVTR